MDRELPANYLWILLPISFGLGVAVTAFVVSMKEHVRHDYLHLAPTDLQPVDQIDEFVKLTVASGLIDQQTMDWLLSEFREGGNRPANSGETIAALTTFLVAKKSLTCWQVAKLRNGQYKGFFDLDGYCLLDLLSKNSGSTTFLAKHRVGGESVAVEVFPPDRARRGVNFRIVRNHGTNHG